MFLSAAAAPLDPPSRLDPASSLPLSLDSKSQVPSSASASRNPVRTRSRPSQSASPANPTPYNPPAIPDAASSLYKRPTRQSSKRRSSITHVTLDNGLGLQGQGTNNHSSDSATNYHGRSSSLAQTMNVEAVSALASNGTQRGPKLDVGRSPSSGSPRKKASRYSPPPAAVKYSPPVPGIPVTPVLRSPSDAPAASEYFGGAVIGHVPSPKKNRSQKNEMNTAMGKSSGVRAEDSTSSRENRPLLNSASNGLNSKASDSAKYRPAQSGYNSSNSRSGHRREYSGDKGLAPQEDPSKQREHRDRDRKTMLSRALQKAHTAVLLDNAQNFEGAIEAYTEACELLQQVLVRSTADEERRKLDQIRETYTNRVQELQQSHSPDAPTQPGKSLPARPMSKDSSLPDTPRSGAPSTVILIEPAKASPPGAVQPSSYSMRSSNTSSDSLPLRSPTLNPQPILGDRYLTITSPMDPKHIPPPLSPRRLPPPEPEQNDGSTENVQTPLADPASRGAPGAWLDTIDESTANSERSSVNSMLNGSLSGNYIQTGGDTEAEFDAALDAAVEAAYDDGLEPFSYDSHRFLAGNGSKAIAQPGNALYSRSDDIRVQTIGDFYEDLDAEEEERILDEMTKDYMLEGFDFGLQTKSALPRQSDSSTFSGSTWHSSVSSSRATGNSSLSTVAESQDQSFLAGAKSMASLPRLSEENSASRPSTSPTRPGSRGGPGGGSVRSRRLSGQNAKQLKIETQPPGKVTQSVAASTSSSTLREEPPSVVRSAGPSTGSISQLPETVINKSGQANGTIPPPANLSTMPRPALSPGDTTVNVSPATPGLSMNDAPPASPGGLKLSGSRPGALKKNQSSTSLKYRALSASSPEGSETAATPLSANFSTYSGGRKLTILGQHPPNVPPFSVDGTHSTGLHLFESDIHSPFTPGSPNALAMDAPIPLEPCPDAHLLRPFWLMRCFYQTIAHPRGGYLSTKLFIPKDVWRVKGVKLKSIDEKVANCDLLTAALLKLGQVDTLDADAVLEEMQSLEQVLDQVQSNLTKKLGHEVGVQGTSSLFKDAPAASTEAGTVSDNAIGGGAHRSVSQGKSYLSSWRKLRSKNSSTGLPSMGKDLSSLSNGGGNANGTKGSGTSRDAGSLTMSSLPMTSLPSIRFAKRDVSMLDISGPNATYMGCLARLFDAVQVVDQIARQVEDPGLKGSSPTHVGLDLCVRHASEFFGFFVCRFVLADLTGLLDKFVKRGSEWVLV